MRVLRRPDFEARSTFELCVGSLSGRRRSAALVRLAPKVGGAEAAYIKAGEAGTVFGLSGEAKYGKWDLGRRMIDLYTSVLSKKSSSLRYIYDDIRAGAVGDICPLCAQRIVSTLDHYLEKSTFPIFAVCPVNLVPACADCNKVRYGHKVSGPADQTLHPYFDNVEDETWLTARVLETTPVAVTFGVADVAGWPSIKLARVRSHFDALGLGRLYSIHAASELVGMRGMISNLHIRAGADGLRAHLLELAESRKLVFRNSWQGALYSALAASEWFCHGGYAQVPAS